MVLVTAAAHDFKKDGGDRKLKTLPSPWQLHELPWTISGFHDQLNVDVLTFQFLKKTPETFLVVCIFCLYVVPSFVPKVFDVLAKQPNH